MLATAQVPVAPITTWGMSLTHQERQRIKVQTAPLKLMYFSTAETRRRRFVPTFFLLEIEGVAYQFLLRFKNGVKNHSLPEGFTLRVSDFDIVLFRKWQRFRYDRDYVEADYPSFVPDELKSLIIQAWKDYGYIDQDGRLAKNKKYANLPPGSVVLSPRVAAKRLMDRRKVA